MSDLGLSGTLATDPMSKLYQRIAALEGRVTAMEGHRDLRVTPFQLSTNTGIFPNSIPFTSLGGKIWLIAGGWTSAALSPSATNGATLKVDNTTLVYSQQVDTTGALKTMTLPFTTLDASAASPAGTHTLDIAIIGTPGASTLYGLLIEWPQ